MASKQRSTTARGYGTEHQALRARWASEVAAGRAYCAEVVCIMSDRWIPPGSAWDLAHGATRQTYRGPAHMRCNRSEGGKRGARKVNARTARSRRTVARGRTSRQW